MHLRILHIDLKHQHYRFEHYLGLLDLAAGWGYNAVLMEYEDMFPYPGHAALRHRDSWRTREVRQFLDRARRLNVEVIPLVQTFGHLGFALRHESYFPLCEDPAEQDGLVESICPSNPQAVALVEHFVQATIDAHPDSRYIHLGGDEALMGVCPRCRRRVARIGRGRHYAEHMNRLIDRVLRAGRRPVIWADCLEHHPAGLDVLRKETILCDWGYESVALRQPWVFVRAGDSSAAVLRGVPRRLRRQGQPWYWAARGCWSPYVTRRNLSGLPAALRRAMRPCWSHGIPDYPAHFHGFPYLRYLHDKGFDVMYAAAMLSGGADNRYAVDLDLHLRNCAAAAQAVAQVGGLGVVTTSWAASGFTPWEGRYLGLALAAQAYRTNGQLDPERAAADYERRTFGRKVGLLAAQRELLACSFVPAIVFKGDHFEPVALAGTAAPGGPSPDVLARFDRLERLIRWADGVGMRHREIGVLRYAAEELLYQYGLGLAHQEWRVSRRMLTRPALRDDLGRIRRRHAAMFRRPLTPWYFRMDRTLRFAAGEQWLAGGGTR